MVNAEFQHALSIAGFHEATWVGDLGDLEKLFDAAVAAERERCARIVETLRRLRGVMMDSGDFFVILCTQGGGYTPLMGDENIAQFETADEAKACARDNMLGYSFGFEVYERGRGIVFEA